MSIFSFIKSFYTTKFKVDKIFSMTMGEICEVCQKELDEKQGLKGKPTMCQDCSKKNNRELKIKKLGL